MANRGSGFEWVARVAIDVDGTVMGPSEADPDTTFSYTSVFLFSVFSIPLSSNNSALIYLVCLYSLLKYL